MRHRYVVIVEVEVVEVGGLPQGAIVNEQRGELRHVVEGDCGSLIHVNGELGQVSLQREGSLQARALLCFHHASDGSNAE